MKGPPELTYSGSPQEFAKMNESLGFMGCSFLRPGTVQRAAWQSNVDVATWAPAPYEVIRRPFIEKEEHPQNQSITSLFVGYYFRRRRRNRPSNRTQQEPSSRSQEIWDIERVWP